LGDWPLGWLYFFSRVHIWGCWCVAKRVFAKSARARGPIDPYLGDFLGKSDFRGFLVEFKRDWGERRTEQEKDKFKILYSIERSYEAAKCHFLGYGYETSTGKFDLKFGKYLNLVLAKNESDVECYCLDEFLQRILEDRIGGNSEEFSNYLGNVIERLKMHFNTGSNAKREVADLNSALRGTAILYTKEGFCTVPFSSFKAFTRKIGIGIELDTELEKVRTESRRRAIEGYDFKIDDPKIPPWD
jgi:hypothetical protein